MKHLIASNLKPDTEEIMEILQLSLSQKNAEDAYVECLKAEGVEEVLDKSDSPTPRARSRSRTSTRSIAPKSTIP